MTKDHNYLIPINYHSMENNASTTTKPTNCLRGEL